MMISRLLSFTALFSAAWSVGAIDWAQVERDWQQELTDTVAQARTAPYRFATEAPGAYLGVEPELGFGVHFMDEAIAEDFRQAGVKLVRHTIYWGAMENTTQAGQYDPAAVAELDKLVQFYADHDMEPVFVVHANAPGTSFANKEESYRRFADFMAFLAARYPQVTYWELWNEMDVSFTDLFGARDNVPMRDRGKFYAEMLKLSYPAIKQANPGAVVIAGSMTNFDEFPQGIYDGGGQPYFDVMNVHSYGIPLKYQFLQNGNRVRRLMIANGDGDKPIWNTEFGACAEGLTSAWGVPDGDTIGIYDTLQLEQLKDCIEIALNTRIYQKYIIYQYRAGTEAGDEMKAQMRAKLGADFDGFDDLSYTLTRRDGSWRPAFQYLVETQPNRAFSATQPTE